MPRSRPLALALAFSLLLAASAGAGELAAVSVTPDSVIFDTLEDHGGLTLTVSDGADFHHRQSFAAGADASFDAAGLADGTYKWELTATPVLDASARAALAQARQSGDETLAERLGRLPARALVQSGSFGVRDGAILDPNAIESPGATTESLRSSPAPGTASSAGPRSAGAAAVTALSDELYSSNDLYVHNSACIGFDCPTSGLNFGSDTIRLKENNLRIHFEDTSTGSFPTTDWRLTANTSINGGLSKFSIDDASAGRSLITAEANAPSNALYVESDGDVGFGTSNPVVDLHVIDGDTPTLRLEQNASSGFTPQTFDVAGNDANFFIRDATNGSTLPFRIRPGAASNSIYIHGDSDVGIGTSSIDADVRFQVQASSNSNFGGLRVENSGTGNIQTQFANTNGGWEWRQTFRSGDMIFDSQEDGANEWELDTAGNVTATSFNPTSDREMKQGFEAVDPASVLERLAAIPVTRWSYRHDPEATPHIGPVAQDFHAAFGVGPDDRHISTTDADGVAFAAIQALYRRLLAKEAALDELAARNRDLEQRLEALEASEP